MLKLGLVVGLLLLASRAEAQVAKVFNWDANPGATSYGVESSNSPTGNGPWTAFVEVAVPLTNCTAVLCTLNVTAPLGITKYRVVTYFGAQREPRKDVGGYACVGLTECPLAASGAGFR